MENPLPALSSFLLFLRLSVFLQFPTFAAPRSLNKPHQSAATTKSSQSSEMARIMLCCTSDTAQLRPGGEDSEPARKRSPGRWQSVFQAEQRQFKAVNCSVWKLILCQRMLHGEAFQFLKQDQKNNSMGGLCECLKWPTAHVLTLHPVSWWQPLLVSWANVRGRKHSWIAFLTMIWRHKPMLMN